MPETAQIPRKGVDSEYYLVCLLRGPVSGYAIGQIVQNKKKSNTKTSHSVTQRLYQSKLIKKEKDGFVIDSDFLADAVARELQEKKKVLLSAKEKKVLGKILKGKGPLAFLSEQIIKKIVRQPPRVHNIDAIQIICDNIGYFAAYFMVARKNMPGKKEISINESQQILDVLDPVWNQISPILEKSVTWVKDEALQSKKYTKKFPFEKFVLQFSDGVKINETFANIVQEQTMYKQNLETDKNSLAMTRNFVDNLKNIVGSFPAIKSFMELPEDTLLKLCLLWDQGHGFVFAWNAFSEKE